jgi:hypothetical protein
MNPIIDMFVWWNRAMQSEEALTANAFAAFYTPDAPLSVNGSLRGVGPDALAQHYLKVRAKLQSVRMVLPVAAEMSTHDMAFVHCFTEGTDLDGRSFREEAMAWAAHEGGRMKNLSVVAAPTAPSEIS